MKNGLSKLRRLNNRKGFTMVEIIIVLVIIAILAAAMIPTMLGFVEDARGKTVAAEARVVYVAAQAVATELEAIKSGEGTSANVIASNTFKTMTNELTGTIGTITVTTSGKIDSVIYTNSGYEVTLNAGGGVTTKKVGSGT